jgi:isocitrate lyase
VKGLPLRGKVRAPTGQFLRTLAAARLAADVLNVPTVVIARTDRLNASCLTSDIAPRDRPFLTGGRTSEGCFRVWGGLEAAVARALAYAPLTDLLWFETSAPDLTEAHEFAQAVHARYQGKLLASTCSLPSAGSITSTTARLPPSRRNWPPLGYRFQFITLAGWRLVNLRTVTLARQYRERGMSADVAVQEEEFQREREGSTAVRH